MRLTQLSRSIVGRRALVTGAASGMGRATVQLFADEGARVAVIDLHAAAENEVVAEINAAHGPDAAIGLVADIGDLGALAQVIDAVVAQLGGVDILINNAGMSVATSAFQDYDEFSLNWDRTLAVYLTAQAHLIRLALPVPGRSTPA